MENNFVAHYRGCDRKVQTVHEHLYPAHAVDVCATRARAAVNYILYRQKEDSDTEIKIILPELYLIKSVD